MIRTRTLDLHNSIGVLRLSLENYKVPSKVLIREGARTVVYNGMLAQTMVDPGVWHHQQRLDLLMVGAISRCVAATGLHWGYFSGLHHEISLERTALPVLICSQFQQALDCLDPDIIIVEEVAGGCSHQRCVLVGINCIQGIGFSRFRNEQEKNLNKDDVMIGAANVNDSSLFYQYADVFHKKLGFGLELRQSSSSFLFFQLCRRGLGALKESCAHQLDTA